MRLPERYDTGLVTDSSELENLTDRLADEGNPVGYDIETSYYGEPRADAAKHPEENFICGFSLTNSLSWARAVPIEFESGPNISPAIAAKCLRRLAEARDGQGRPLLVAHNCFTGDTEFLTSEGLRRLDAVAGREVEVWTEAGWVKAPVRQAGTSQVLEIEFAPSGSLHPMRGRSRTSIRHFVRATPNHRWQVRRRCGPYTENRIRALDWVPGYLESSELRPGDQVPAQLPSLDPERDSDGFRHGLIFADGAETSSSPLRSGERSFQLRLCGRKDEFADLFNVTYPISAGGDPVCNSYHSWTDLKALPPDDASPQYLANFIAGWSDLDGLAGSGGTRICVTTKRAEVEWLRRRAASAGWIVSGVSWQSGGRGAYVRRDGRRPKIYRVSLTRDPELLWTVRAVREVPGEHEVFCPEVPEIGRFTLGPGIYTANSVFELRCTARLFARELGLTLEDAYFDVRSDTMVEAYIEAEHESYALKQLTRETFGVKMTEIMELFETPGAKNLTKFQQDSIQFHLLDPQDPKVIDYMCDDAHKALAHHLLRYPKVTDPGFRGAFLYRVDMGQLPVICDMSDTGIAYDWAMMREAAQRGQAFLSRLGAEINADLAAQLGRPVALNLASPPQIQKVLYDKVEGLGLPVGRRSKKTGKPSTDKQAIKQLAGHHPVARKIQDYRQIKRRVQDNYAGKYEQDYNYAPDGRAHPNILYTAAVTGRFAFSRPAAQQPPKTVTWSLATGETFTFPWRDFITVPPPGDLGDTEHKGWYILGFDLSQAELRAMAGEARESALLEEYSRPGADVHRLTASRMLGVPFDQVTKEQRDIGKTLNLALQYQLSAPSLAERLGVPKNEGQRLYDAWFAGYPRIKAWTEQTVASARRDGYTMSRFGRKHPIWEFAKVCEFCASRGVVSKWTSGARRCPRCNGLGTPKSAAVIAHGERLAGNAPVQGAATGDYVRVAQIRADRALRQAGIRDKVRLFLNVHDSLDFYVRKDVSPGEAIKVLQPAVVFPVEGWPEVVADWHAGLRMGSLKELEVGPDWSVSVKGAKAESPVAGDEDDEDDVQPLAVDLTAVRAVTRAVPDFSQEKEVSPDVPAVPAEDGSQVPVLAAPEEVPPRTVIITVPSVPDKAAAVRLKEFTAGIPGANTVILRTEAYGDIRLPATSALGPDHQADVAFIMPGAEVTYDQSSVDYAAIAAGIAVLPAWARQVSGS